MSLAFFCLGLALSEARDPSRVKWLPVFVIMSLTAVFGFAFRFITGDGFALMAAFGFVVIGGGVSKSFNIAYCTLISGTTSTGQWAAFSSLSLNDPMNVLYKAL